MDINATKQERAKLAKQARGILDAAQAAGRDITSEEGAEFDRLMDRADTLEKDIKREERAREHERQVADNDSGRGDDEPNGPGRTDEQKAREAFRRYIRDGRAALTEAETRALNMGSDPEGGFLVAPQQFVQELIKALDDAVPLRPLATTMTLTTGESLGVPALDTDLNDADWTSEVATGAQDDAMRFGKRELRPHPLAKRVKVSRTLLRRATMDPEDIVRDRLKYKFAVTQEKAFMTGDGNEKPLGVFTASTQGISTGRDVTFGATGAIPLTAASADQLIDAKYTLKAAYWPRSRWLFHRDLVRTIRKFKDSQNQYLWQPGMASDRPDTILDLPFLVSEFAPNTVSANQYVGMLADWSFYWIADALDMEIQRLVELYAETNQVGFIARQETDAMPVLEEAFVRLKVPA